MDIRVYDWQGNERDSAYLRAKYGDYVVHTAPSGEGPVYRLAVLREKVDTAATLVVSIRDENGSPLEGVLVAWYWPDAPTDPNAGPQGGLPAQVRTGRAVSGLTNLNGDTGFGMGRGAYYFASQGQIGPHAAWVHGQATRSDVIFGLGMLGGTNHDHYDLEYVRVLEEDGPPAPADVPRQELLAELARIEQAIQAIRRLID